MCRQLTLTSGADEPGVQTNNSSTRPGGDSSRDFPSTHSMFKQDPLEVPNLVSRFVEACTDFDVQHRQH